MSKQNNQPNQNPQQRPQVQSPRPPREGGSNGDRGQSNGNGKPPKGYDGPSKK